MKVNTKAFGEVEYNENEIITFRTPILGFEDCQRFILLHDAEIGEQFAWLQSLDETDLCFVMFDPSALGTTYEPVIPVSIAHTLGSEEFACWVLVTVAHNFAKSTVNLKSPIIISMQNLQAAQVVLEQKYPIRFPIVGGGATC